MDTKTEWAEDRTVLADERTFAGWMRTGAGAIALAVALRATFNGADPAWLPKIVATIFILAAICIFYAAWRQAIQGHRQLSNHAVETQKQSHFGRSSIAFSIGAVVACGFLWML